MFWHMHRVLNEVYLQNFLHGWVVNREMNLMSLLNPPRRPLPAAGLPRRAGRSLSRVCLAAFSCFPPRRLRPAVVPNRAPVVPRRPLPAADPPHRLPTADPLAAAAPRRADGSSPQTRRGRSLLRRQLPAVAAPIRRPAALRRQPPAPVTPRRPHLDASYASARECVVDRGDPYLHSILPDTQNGWAVCIFCWSLF